MRHHVALIMSNKITVERIKYGVSCRGIFSNICGVCNGGSWYCNDKAGPRLNIKTVLSTYGDFHVKDKTAVRTFIFNMGIAIPGKTVFLIETAPRLFVKRPRNCYPLWCAMIPDWSPLYFWQLYSNATSSILPQGIWMAHDMDVSCYCLPLKVQKTFRPL